MIREGWAGGGVAAKPMIASVNKAEVIPSPSGMCVCIAAP